MKKVILLVLLISLFISGCSEKTNNLEAKNHYSYEISDDSSNYSNVYFTQEITSSSLTKLYTKLDKTLNGQNIAVKLSTGEPPNSNYLGPSLIKDIVQSVNGTIVECNTAYGGSRSETQMHYQVAKDHGFTEIADFKILDEEGESELPVVNGKRLTNNIVGSSFLDYDSYLVLSHFKGHSQAGYGGAIKNISIGLASSDGKSLIHNGGDIENSEDKTNSQDKFLEAMGEAAKSVTDSLGDQIVYINIMNNISIDCDCSGNPAEPDIHDIGVLASTDPVALDQACIDLIYQADGNETFIDRLVDRNGEHTLEYAQTIGLGNRSYNLVTLD